MKFFENLSHELADTMVTKIKGRYLLSFSKGCTEFIMSFKSIPAYIGYTLAITAAFTVTISPLGWMILSSVLFTAAICSGMYTAYRTYVNLAQLKHNAEILAEIARENESNQAKLNHLKRERDELLKELRLFTIPVVEVEVPPSVDKLNNLKPIAKLGTTIIDTIKTTIRYLIYPVIWLAAKMHLLSLEPTLNMLDFLIEQLLKIQATVREYVTLFTLTGAVLTGLFSLIAHVIAVNLSGLGLEAAFIALTGLSGPVGLVLFFGISGSITLLLIINKLIFSDPLDLLMENHTKKQEQIAKDKSALNEQITHIEKEISNYKSSLHELKNRREIDKAVLTNLFDQAVAAHQPLINRTCQAGLRRTASMPNLKF